MMEYGERPEAEEEFTLASLEEERRGLLEQIATLDRSERLEQMEADLEEMREILKKQKIYAQNLGLFKRTERKRMEAQLMEREQLLADKEVELENLQHEVEDKIVELNLAVMAIETEIERRCDK